jgi:hypothetical protein
MQNSTLVGFETATFLFQCEHANISTILVVVTNSGPKYIYIYTKFIEFFWGPKSFIKKSIFGEPKALAWAALPLGRPC